MKKMFDGFETATEEELRETMGGASASAISGIIAESIVSVKYGVMLKYGVAPKYGVMLKYGVYIPTTEE